MIIVVVGETTPRLTSQLAGLPDRAFARVRTIPAADPATTLADLADLARRAAENGDGLAVVPGDLVVSDTPLLAVLDDPRPTARVLVGSSNQPVRVTAGRVTAVGTARHRLPELYGALGLLHLPADATPAAAAAWAHAARVTAEHGWTEVDPLQAALLAVVRAGVPVSPVSAPPYVGARDPAALPAAAALNEEDLTWRNASRGGDGVWSTFVLRPISRRISRRAVRVGLTPNQVTAFSFVLGLVAAALIAVGEPVSTVAGALLFQASLVVDCVDGEVARSTRSYSPFGAWADVAGDRVKEYAALAAIAVATGAWGLALLGLALQLIRHMCDYAFADTLLAWWRAPVVDRRPYAATEAPGEASGRGDAVDRSGVGPRGWGLVHWAKQAIHLQIGERWLLISVSLIVGVAIDRPLALIVYPVAVGLGLVWVLTGWTLRTLTHTRRNEPMPATTAAQIARLRDDGLLSPRPQGSRRPWAWLLPAVTTAVEAAVLLVATVLTPGPAAYLWLFAVAWHRYDLHYRDRAGRTPVPMPVTRLGGGWAVRSLVVAIAALLGQLFWVLPVGAAWLLLVYVPESLYRAVAVPPTGTYAEVAALDRSQRIGLLRKRARRAVAVPVTRLLMRVRPSHRMALVAGLPDSEENALVTAVGLAGRYPGEVVLVAGDPAAARRHLDRTARLLGGDAGRVQIVAKSDRRTFDRFVRAELVAYTHGLYDSPRPVGRRLHVNLWHGTGPKWNANANFTQRIGAQAHSASSSLWGREAIRALSMGPDTRLVAGNPRCDVLARPGPRDTLIDLHLDPARPVVVWLPTFRRSERAGLVGLAEGDQLTADHQAEIAAVHRAAKAAKVQLVAKPHRLDADSYADLGIPTISTEDLTAVGVSVYQLLGLADGLISDYSSVWVDLLGLPTSIGLWVPDLARYQRARGLNRPSLELVAAELFLTGANAAEFFAAVGDRTTWRPEARERLAERIELIDVPPGAVTATMLTELGRLAAERFGDDLGLS